MEVCTRVLARDNKVTIRWVPAHHGVPGSEIADEYAKTAAEGSPPRDEVPDEYNRWETSLSNMTKAAAEARPVLLPNKFPVTSGPSDATGPPRGEASDDHRRRVRKSFAGRYF